MSSDDDFIDDDAPVRKGPGGDAGGNKKRLSVERIYQKKSQLEHILLRPDTYIGSVEQLTQNMWVYDEEVGMNLREITFVPGLYKIFDEILVNAADNKQRDKKMDTIKVEIDADRNKISIWNNGEGIPVVEHKDEKMYVPTMIFGHLLTSSNYNDEEQKVTGGRNGYGAKLCNIFSTKFIVETANKKTKKSFKQVWTNNMGSTTEPKITAYGGEDFTSITFHPDLPKFGMTVLDKDTIALLSKRAYDIAGAGRGIKVTLNGKKLPVKGFKDYIDQYIKGKEDETGNPLKVVYEQAGERWEVGLALSVDKGFQQVSFVNSIATTKGGRHVDYVADQIVSKVIEKVKQKNKNSAVQVRPFQIKNHIWIFVNSLIVNPTFDSQTKENMTLQMKNFGSKCALSEKFFVNVLKCGIVESVLNWVKFKADAQLGRKCSSTKHSKLKGIPKLEDANDAGTARSLDCTLILTEGDSAKTLAVSGLSVIGRDKYGVFPLRGKMLNVREATQKQILENAEINNIIKIIGLQYKKKYESIDDLKKLRYGKMMIMTDQDQDGSHIKGLLINFIHHNWPTLLKLPFLEEFITPIVKATRKDIELKFYSLPEFEEWKTQTNNWNKYKIKYYKGLGTSTAKEAKEYFSDMIRHRIKFKYQGTEDDKAIELAFSKKMIEQRKEWLTNGMEERKQRRELGLPEMYVYGKTTTAISYSEFVNKELILFSNTDNERSIPSLVDGLKPGQRKVLFTCFKRNDKREVKVAQLAGSVAEHSAYHHGEQSLMGTIINLAQNYVGSNNINLLQPIGQFGTRLQGGKDSASPRYIFTMLSTLARHIISALDEPLLHHLKEDNQKIEPEYYIPIIPMVLVNGAEGIGTGWSTKVPNYNPREIVKNLLKMIAGEEPTPMIPWFKNFRGTIIQVDNSHFVSSGECAILSDNKFEITELPVKTWTQVYKEGVLESLLHGGGEKQPAMITDYKEYTTDTTVRFVISMNANFLSQYEDRGLHRIMKLQTSFTTSSMVLFDSNGVLRRYTSPEEILKEFYTLRLEFYVKRKDYLEGMLQAEADKLTNQARFILEMIDRKIILDDKKKATVIKVLIERKYDTDPVRIWKEQKDKESLLEETPIIDEEEEGAAQLATQNGDTGGPDYNYLLQMHLMSLTKEVKEELLKKKEAKLQELKHIQKQSPSDLWKEDLKNFLAELDAVEKKERDDENIQVKKTKGYTKQDLKSKEKISVLDTKPSKHGQRVLPAIDEETKKKIEKSAETKKKSGKPAVKPKKEKYDDDDDDDDVDIPPLAERIGNSPAKMEEERAKKSDGAMKPKKEPKKGLKQTTLGFKKAKKESPPKKGGARGGKKSKLSDTDSEEEEANSSDGSDFAPVQTSSSSTTTTTGLGAPPPPRRAATNANKRYTFNSDVDSEEEQEVPKAQPAKKSEPVKKETDNIIISDDEDEKANGDSDKWNGAKATASSDSDSDSQSKKKDDRTNGQDTDALFNSLLGDSSPEKASPIIAPTKTTAANKRLVINSDTDDSSNEAAAPPSPAPPTKKAVAPKRARVQTSSDDSGSSGDDFKPSKSKKAVPPKKKGKAKETKKAEPKKAAKMSDDNNSDSSFEMPAARGRTGRAKPSVKYNFSDDDASDD